MTVRAFRITKTRHLAGAFDVEGARRNGGRWNSVGTSVVYLAGTLSGATLEILVHTDDYSLIEGLYSHVPVGIPAGTIERIDPGHLPEDWNSPVPIAATKALGDRWIGARSSAVLEVPSAVTEGESNYLVNPGHPDFARLQIGEAKAFGLDPRLL